jgi:hypothetical protein
VRRATRARTWLAAGAVAVGMTTHCTGRGPHEEEASVSSRSIEEVLATHTDSLMSLPGVVGTAIGLCDGVPCIRVFLSDSGAVSRRKIPNRLDGYPVRVDVTGPLRPRQDEATGVPR